MSLHACMKCVKVCVSMLYYLYIICVDVSQSKVAPFAPRLGKLIWNTASQAGHVRLHTFRNDRQDCFSKFNNVNKDKKCNNAKYWNESCCYPTSKQKGLKNLFGVSFLVTIGTPMDRC